MGGEQASSRSEEGPGAEAEAPACSGLPHPPRPPAPLGVTAPMLVWTDLSWSPDSATEQLCD